MGLFTSRPLKNYSAISSYFLDRRAPRKSPHQGTDWPAPRWTPIRAIFNCKVIDKGYDDVYGHWIKLRSLRKHEVLVGHMVRESTLKIGQGRRRLQTVGYVGESGAATGPHVHLSVWQLIKGRLILVDPATFIRTH